MEEQRSGGARCSMLTVRQTRSDTVVSCERERPRSREQRKPGGPRSRAEKFDGRTAAAEGARSGQRKHFIGAGRGAASRGSLRGRKRTCLAARSRGGVEGSRSGSMISSLLSALRGPSRTHEDSASALLYSEQGLKRTSR